MTIIKGNINNSLRGWIAGQFFPEDSPFKDTNIEIYYKIFPKGDIGDKLHVHPHGHEYLIILEGQLRMLLGNEEITLQKGDYIKIPNGAPDKIVEVIEPATIIGVRYPSVPDNKKLLE